MSKNRSFCEEAIGILGEIEASFSKIADGELKRKEIASLAEKASVKMRLLADLVAENNTTKPTGSISAIKSMNTLILLDYSLDDLCRKIVEILVFEMGFCNASILLFNNERETLELMAAFGLKDSEKPPDFAYNKGLSFKPGRGTAGKAFLEGHTIIIEDMEDSEDKETMQTAVDIKTLISLPIIVETEKIGVINLSYENRTEIDDATKQEIDLIKGIVGYILLAYTKDRSLKQSNTELKDKIRIQGTYFAQILENLPVAVCELSFDNNEFFITQANPAFYRISGTPPEIIDPKLAVYFQEKETYKKAVKELIMNKKYALNGTMMRKFDGSDFIGDIFLDQSSVGEKNLYSIVVIDKTDEYKLEQRFIQSDKINSLGRLAEGISHDIKNLFSGVTLALQALQKKLEDASGIEKYVNMISDSANRGVTLSNDLLEFARGKTPELRKIQIETVIENCVNVVKSAILPKINLRIYLPDKVLPGIKGDLSQLEQALFNLIINAKDSIIGKGEITIKAGETAREGKSLIFVEVSDNGIGIPKNIIRNIFDPFFTTKSKSYGSGLGLSITYRIVKNHGGDILVKSTEGEGSVFTLEFPVFQKDEYTDISEIIVS